MVPTRQVALFRAINVGGSNIIPMVKLIDLAIELGFANNRTILQSGNLIFDNHEVVPELSFESDLHRVLRVETDVMIRTSGDLQEIVNCNPFKDIVDVDPSHLLVMFLKSEPVADAVSDLRNAIVGREEISLHGRELYVTYPDGIGRSKLTSKLIERHLNTSCTGRNWNTILKINTDLHTDAQQAKLTKTNGVSSSIAMSVAPDATSAATVKPKAVSRKRKTIT